MDSDARDQVGRALELLASGLAPLVEQRMRARRELNWYDAYRGRNDGPSLGQALMDPRFLLKVMTAEWDAFSPPLSRRERNLVFELRETGNRWAHYERFTWDDVDRALDSVERLLTPVDTETAATVRQVRLELRRSHDAEGGQPRGDGPTRDTEAWHDEAPMVPSGGASAPTPGESSRTTDIPGAGREGRVTNWRLILSAACALTAAGHTPFGRMDVYEWIWTRYPRSEHERATLDPTLQGMIKNAPSGAPSSAGGKPLHRIDRGRFELIDPSICDEVGNEARGPASPDDQIHTRPSRRSRAIARTEVRSRVDSLIAEFDECVDEYDRSVPFTRSGQYEFHRRTIDRRLALGSVSAAIHDDQFTELLHATLKRWGMGRRASILVPLDEFRLTLASHETQLLKLEPLTIESLAGVGPSTKAAVDSLVTSLKVVHNRARIVAGTKTLHHLLPDLVPPMDRAWTGAFFGWSVLDPQNNQTLIFEEAFSAFTEIAGVTYPSRLVGGGWRTSSTKVLDNALIGYCKLKGIGGTPT